MLVMMMASGFRDEAGKILPSGLPLVDARVPPYHIEFSAVGHLPPEIDVVAAQKLLLNSFENSRSINTWEMKALKGSPDGLMGEAKRDLSTAQDIIKRLGATDKEEAAEGIKWFFTAPIDSMRSRKRHLYGTSDGGRKVHRIFHSFSNVNAGKEVLKPGTCHVAVGFLDLNNLATSVLLWPSDPEPRSSDGPLAWVGYESSYAVAKTLAIAELLKMNAPSDSVLQVWFSSAWSCDTLAYFRKALSQLGG